MEKNIRTIRWITFAALVASGAAFLFPLISWRPLTIIAGMTLVIVAAALLTWALEAWLQLFIRLSGKKDDSKENTSGGKENPGLGPLLEFNQCLLSAQSVKEVVELLLRFGMDLLEAAGASFVSFDEWGNSLPPLTRGTMPMAESEQWRNQLTNPAIRQACRGCTTREAKSDCPLYNASISSIGKIYCQSVRDDAREIGIISYYFPYQKEIESSQRILLQNVTENVTIALSSMRRRNQENAAFIHLQAPVLQWDLPGLLRNLVTNIMEAIVVKSAYIWLPQGLPGDLSSPVLILPSDELSTENGLILDNGFFTQAWESIQASRQFVTLEKVPSDPIRNSNALLIIPLIWQNERPVGLICLVNDTPLALSSLQTKVLQTIAGEASLLIQHSRMSMHKEYQAVVEERTRLAREIHDGLSQTLAFLKIQSIQMQAYLSAGKFDKLEETLAANKLTLSSAYEDSRQAIDDLRLVPGFNTQDWLIQLARNFTESTGIVVDVSQLKLMMNFPPTLQAQLVRIVQEAFSNIRKHAQARNVILFGEVHENEVILEIRDDGVGFEPEQIESGSKYGLLGMQERTDSLGGEFQIISRNGSGTTIRLSVPLGVTL